MASFNKFLSFVEAMAEKSHNLGSDQLKIALTSVAPVNTNTVLANLTEIAYTNLSTRNVTTTSSTQTAGTYTLTLTDLVLTASGGSVAAFQYVVLYNDTATNDELIGWWDVGSVVNMIDGSTFLINFDGSAGVLQNV